MLAGLLVISWIGPAKSHSWYDEDCCDQHDCAPVISMSFNKANNNWTMTTKHGTAVFNMKNKSVSHRFSQDGQVHACMFTDMYSADGLGGASQGKNSVFYIRCVYWPVS